MFSKGEIKQLNTPNGRFYSTPDGIFPSVTTILSSNKSAELNAWRDEVGHNVADKIANKAAATGSRLHQYCEDYLTGKPTKLDIFDTQSFRSIRTHLDLINPVFVEKAIWSKELAVAGTIDCFGTYNKKISIIDFKTTKQEKYPGEFDNYWMQTAAYAQMIFEHTGKRIDNLVLIMQNTTLGCTEVFQSETSNWIDRFRELRLSFKGEYDDKEETNSAESGTIC